MNEPAYTQPDTCLVGKRYYLKSSSLGKTRKYHEVTFIGYRPHPGEIVVDDGSGPRVVHRLFLYVNGQAQIEDDGTLTDAADLAADQ